MQDNNHSQVINLLFRKLLIDECDKENFSSEYSWAL